MTQSQDEFYLGRGVEGEAPVLYDHDNLITHAVVVGMLGFLVNLII